MSVTGVVLFVFTYLLISLRRLSWLPLDRPAGVLLGALLCVHLGALTPSEALEAVDWPTLVLLFGVMGMGTFLAVDGVFSSAEPLLVSYAGTPARLLGCIVWTAGIGSAFITNDAVCVLGAPVIVGLVKRYGLSPLPFLLALATAANTGSVATLVGNPQNMLCAALGELSYGEHLMVVGPLALLCLGINHGLLHVMFKERLVGSLPAASQERTPLAKRSWMTLGVIAATAVTYSFGASLPAVAISAFVLLMLLHRRSTAELWPRIDWSLLLFFGGLFVVVEAFVKSGAPSWFFSHYPLAAGPAGSEGWLRLSGIFLVGSNLVSNVPFILLIREQMATLPNPKLAWELLAVASTFAGNLTLLGSAANIIVAESAHEIGGIGFVDYLRIGFPLALITTLIGALWLLAFFPV